MDLKDTVALVTGANRGLGRHLVEALLARGAGRVYAAARDVSKLPTFDDRVVALRLDITDRAAIAAAAAQAVDTRLLINNASAAIFTDPLAATHDDMATEMATNHLGTFDMNRAFAPVIEANGGGTIVNVLSLLSLAATPPMAGYCASKAAAHSATQALRPVLLGRGVRVLGAYPAGIDTEMLSDFEDMPKTAPRIVADGVLDGIEADQEDIFPDPNSQAMSQTWFSDPKSFERAFSGA